MNEWEHLGDLVLSPWVNGFLCIRADLSKHCVTSSLYRICAHTHVHKSASNKPLQFHCLLNVYENTESAADKRNAPALLPRTWLHIIRSIIENNNKHCGRRSTHKSLLAEQAFRWVKKLSEEQKHHYPSAWVSTKYFSNDSGRAAKILFNQEPL